MQDFKLKSYVLTSQLSIIYWGKTIDTFFDVFSAWVIIQYISSPLLKFMLWGKRIDHFSQLSLIYWVINEQIKNVILSERRECEYAKSHLKWAFISFDDWAKLLEERAKLSESIKAYFGERYKGKIETTDYLNSQLEDIIQYGLYSDEEFNRLTKYFSSMVFNSSVEQGDSTKVKIWDKFLEVTVDDWPNISDELINYIEQKVLWYDFDTWNLRKIIGFEPWGWQRYFLVSQKRFNYVVSSRRSWKSYLMAYLVIRQMFLKHQDIVYVVPVMDQAEQVFEYIERFVRDIWDDWLRFDRARKTIAYKRTRSLCTFVSAESKYTGRSRRAHMLFIDEASFVNDKVEKTLRPLISNTMGWMISVSTVSPDSPINWFYFGFKKWELKIKENILSIRVDIYKNIFIPDEEKQELLEHYKNDTVMLQTELLAMFPSSWSWFNLRDFFLHCASTKEYTISWIKFKFKSSIEEMKNEYNWFVIWYDPAMRRDKWWFTLVGHKKLPYQEWDKDIRKNVFETVWAAYINVVDYTSQINVIKSLSNELRDQRHSCVIWMDYTGSGMGVYELMQWMWIKDIRRIFWTGTRSHSEPTYDNGVWKVSKDDLESFFRASMWTSLFAYNYLEDLRSEIEMYGITERVWESHFDQLSSLFVAWFVCKRYVWEYYWVDARSKLTEEWVVDYLENIYKKNDEYFELFWQHETKVNAHDRYKKFIY